MTSPEVPSSPASSASPKAHARGEAPARSIDALRWDDLFVRTLPGDPVRENFPRQVEGACYSHVAPTKVRAPELVCVVPEVAALIGLDPEATPALTEVLAGNRVVSGTSPYAACYGGHQFGHWAGQLGDGRAITLGEVLGARDERFELQLKGAGPTPYRRRADGRAVLRSSLRELVCSEAMHHLGVPTTRALSLATTGEAVVRDMLYDGHPEDEPGAIVCRVAPSFLRFGNFEILAARSDTDTLGKLVRFTLEQHYPAFLIDGVPDFAAFVSEVGRRTARMVVEWMRVGFVHGVMNTDNMSVLGLTIDYGPFGFLDVYDPDWTPNTTDANGGRYRYGNQPRIAHWNLVQLARALSLLVDDTAPLQRAVDTYGEEIAARQRRMLLDKLGLRGDDGQRARDEDALLMLLSQALTSLELDMTLFFRRLADVRANDARSHDARVGALLPAFYEPEQASAGQLAHVQRFLDAYFELVRSEALADDERRARMNAVNPLYVPRNYLLQETIDKTREGDRSALAELLEVLRKPYEEQPGREAYAKKRPEWARHRVGCSMLSCSS